MWRMSLIYSLLAQSGTIIRNQMKTLRLWEDFKINIFTFRQVCHDSMQQAENIDCEHRKELFSVEEQEL